MMSYFDFGGGSGSTWTMRLWGLWWAAEVLMVWRMRTSAATRSRRALSSVATTVANACMMRLPAIAST